MRATSYHNPECATSRNTLALPCRAYIEPHVIKYLATSPDRETLARLITEADLTLRQAAREKGTTFAELGFDRPGVTDAQIVERCSSTPSTGLSW